ncbi:outer membrane beta-barrel protein [Bacteroidota bacterium]
MKTRKLLLPILLFAFLLPTALMAQNPTEKGRFIFDTDFSLNWGSMTADDAWETEMDHRIADFEFDFGYTIINDLEVGVRASYDHNYLMVENAFINMEETENTLSYGIFARYYFLDESKLKPFIGVSGGIGNMTMESTGAEDIEYKLTSIGGNAGLVYFFNQHFGIEVVYNIVNYTVKTENPTVKSNGLQSHLALGVVVSF